MDSTIKARWLAALRSGDYTQGVDYLHQIEEDKEHTFCCLGVLCELAVEDGKAQRYDEANEPYSYGLSHEGESIDGLPVMPDLDQASLPVCVTEWAELGPCHISGSALAEKWPVIEPLLSDAGKRVLRNLNYLPPLTDRQSEGAVHLEMLNDGGMSFSDIAILIEHCL